MRRTFINGVLGGVHGTMLAAMGYPLSTWQFWASMFVLSLVVVNSIIGESHD